VLAFEGIRYPDFATFPANANFETGGNLRMPLLVKPLRMDASIGIDERSLVRNTQRLMERVLYIKRISATPRSPRSTSRDASSTLACSATTTS
jgi:hypothetical protein